MVYSTELGYDPEEWEECPEPDHFLAFGFFTRIWLSLLTVVLSVLFFWLLESKKHWNKLSEDLSELDEQKTRAKEVLRRNTINDMSNPLADHWHQIVEETQKSRAASGNTTPKGRRSSKKPLTADEVVAMQDWENQLNKLAERRLRESQEHDLSSLEGGQQKSQDVGKVSTFGLPDNAFDNQSMLSEFTGGNAASLLRDIQHLRVSECATPSSTPPGGALSLEAHYRQMADDLEKKLLREIRAEESFKIDTPPNSLTMEVQRKLTEQLHQRYEQDIDRAVEQLQMEHADELASTRDLGKDFKKKLESQIEGLVRQHSQGIHRQDNLDREVLRPKQSSDNGNIDQDDYGVNFQRKLDHKKEYYAKENKEEPVADFYDEKEIAFKQQQHKKSSSSSDEGFVKVHRENSDPTTQQTAISNLQPIYPSEESELLIAPSPTLEGWQKWGSESAGVSNSPGPRISIEIDDTTTADDIEFVLQGQSQASPVFSSSPFAEIETSNDSQEGVFPPQMVVIPDSLDIKSAATKQDQDINDSKPSSLDAREEEQVLKLLQEYELGGVTGPKQKEEAVGNALESPSGFDIIQVEQSEKPQFGYEQKNRKRLEQERIIASDSDEKSPYEEVKVKKTDEKISTADSIRTTERENFILNDSIKKSATTQRSPVLSRQMPIFEIEEAYDEQRKKINEFEKKEQVFVSERALDQDPKRLVQAEIFLQDAMDFMETQQPRVPSVAGGFVMEEEMLESDKQPVPVSAKALAKQKVGQNSEKDAQNASADPTSRLIKTNEVFEKPEPLFDDADDAMTYAPEIQSVDIPPDQLSENSLNLVENFSEHHEIQAASAEEIKKREEMTGQAQNKGEMVKQKMETNHSEKKTTSPKQLQRAASPRIEARGNRGSTSAPKAPQFLRQRKDGNGFDDISTSSISSSSKSLHKQSSLLSALGVTSTQEMLLKLPSLDALSDAMRRAGLESTNLIFGIDYTASNKYQGEYSFKGKSLHSVQDHRLENPYQQVIKIMGRTLAPFATSNGIPVYGFGDSTTGDWSVFALNGPETEECCDLDEVLRVYNEVTPQVNLSGPTNFAPLIYKAVSLCDKNQDYHILVIIADGQVTNERATRKAIVNACQFPLSIIVVGVGDGPWDMMKVFDESLPKRPWDNFHFVEFHDIINEQTQNEAGELDFAIHSMLEVPDQYEKIKQMGLLVNSKKTPMPSKPSTATTTPLPEQDHV